MDIANSNGGPVGFQQDSGSGTTADAGQLYFFKLDGLYVGAITSDVSGNTLTQTSGYKQRLGSPANVRLYVFEVIESGLGAQKAIGTLGSSADWGGICFGWNQFVARANGLFALDFA